MSTVMGQANTDGAVIQVVKFNVPGVGEVDYHLPEEERLDTGDRMTWKLTSVVSFVGDGEGFDKRGFGKKPRHPAVRFYNLARSFEVVSFASRDD